MRTSHWGMFLIAVLYLPAENGRAQTAQDLMHVAPRAMQVTPSTPVIALPEQVTPPITDQNRQILPELKGLKLVAGIGQFRPVAISGSGVMVEKLPMLDAPEIRKALARFIGKPLTFATFTDISRTIVAWYRKHHHPFVDVAFPEQPVSSGVIQAVVTEFYVGEITVEGNLWFASDLIRRQLRLQRGDVIDDERLRDDLLWLNRNPFRQVSVIAQMSATEGATDLVLRTEDRFPLSVYVELDNDGPQALAPGRWRLGFNWGNAFGSDQQLSYQFTASDDFWQNNIGSHTGPLNTAFVAHALNYEMGLPWRDTLVISGSYYRVVPRLGPFLGLVGVAGEASLRYVAALPKFDWLSHALQLGYDYKTGNSNLTFGDFLVYNVTAEINQFVLVYDASANDDYGVTLVDNQLVYSPGHLTPGNNDAAFQAQANNPFARASYIYDRISVTRFIKLPEELTWVMRLTVQDSDCNLLPSEQLQAGGVDSVRGYYQNAVSGSLGILLSEEIRSPPFSPAKILMGAAIADQAQLDAFWDYANVKSKTLSFGLPGRFTLSSVGVGLRYNVGTNLSLRFEYGWQLQATPGPHGHSQLPYFEVSMSY